MYLRPLSKPEEAAYVLECRRILFEVTKYVLMAAYTSVCDLCGHTKKGNLLYGYL